jgi:MoaA/NifB/PqqE/SkfB family radical SAM enzyme
MNGRTVIWEITGSCELSCIHCSGSRNGPPLDELTTYEAYKTIDQIAALKPRRFIITGGDPLARRDLGQIVDYGRRRGLRTSVEVVPTSHLNANAIDDLVRAGVDSLLFNMDGVAADATLEAIRNARAAAIPFEINTLVTRRSLSGLPALADLVGDLGAQAWNLYFLVPIGMSRKLESVTAEEAERVFGLLADLQAVKPYRLRAVEAPAYRRFLMQRNSDRWSDFANYLPEEIADCVMDDVVFISARGAVRPGPFLPVTAGNLRFRPLQSIVNGGDLFLALRDRTNLTGKCGYCDYRQVCGGSRARAFATTGVLFAPDPMCAYQPPRKELS